MIAWNDVKEVIKQFFSLDDEVVATMMILIVVAFFSGLVLLFLYSYHHKWDIDNTAFSVFFGTFVTAGVIKIVSDKVNKGVKNGNITE